MAPESRPKYPIAFSVTSQRHAKSGFFLVPFLGPKNDNFQKKDDATDEAQATRIQSYALAWLRTVSDMMVWVPSKGDEQGSSSNENIRTHWMRILSIILHRSTPPAQQRSDSSKIVVKPYGFVRFQHAPRKTIGKRCISGKAS